MRFAHPHDRLLSVSSGHFSYGRRHFADHPRPRLYLIIFIMEHVMTAVVTVVAMLLFMKPIWS